MEVRNTKSKTVERIFWGLMFLCAGAAIVLNLVGVSLVPKGVSMGDAVWTAVLAMVFIWSLIRRFWFFTFVSLLGAAYVWYAELGFNAKAFWAFAGAAILLCIGFSILFRPRKLWKSVGAEACKRVVCNISSSDDGAESETGMGGGGVFTESDGDENNVYIKASFGATIKYVNAKALKRADLDCSFGSIKAFFDNASVSEGGASININNSFGGVELYMPKEWHLIDNVSRVFGGVDIKNPEHEQGTGPVVTLTGNVKFGGVEIVLV